jgi:hypothetical protein
MTSLGQCCLFVLHARQKILLHALHALIDHFALGVDFDLHHVF